MIKIIFKKGDCIGCGACAAVCNDYWDLEDGKAKPVTLELEEIGCNQEAADACPMNCIMLLEE